MKNSFSFAPPVLLRHRPLQHTRWAKICPHSTPSNFTKRDDRSKMALSSKNPSIHNSKQDKSKPDKLEQLRHWCSTNGIVFHSIEILSRNGQRGLFATSEIESGKMIVSIPRTAAIMADIIHEEPPTFHILRGLSRSFWKKASWEIRLAIMLLEERARGDASPFCSYLDALPEDPWSALWAYETIGRKKLTAQLRPYNMQQAADSYRAYIKSSLAAFRKALPAAAREHVSLKLFSWAMAICQSRAFGVRKEGTEEKISFSFQDGESSAANGGPPVHFQKKKEVIPIQYALFPGLDMANHSVHCQTSFKYDADSDSYQVYAGASFTAGQEVLISYGPKNNDDLMFFYSFVEGNNPANNVKLTDFREWILDLAHKHGQVTEDWDRKLKLLIENRLILSEKSHAFQIESVTDDLMLSLRLALATNGDLEMILNELESNPDRLKKPVSLKNELACWHAIQEKCQHMLEELGEFTEEEQEELNQLFSDWPCSAVWTWGKSGSPGELLYRYERQTVLSATSERVKHFANISSTVGRICTVLMPPTQSLLKTDIFTGMGEDETAGVHKFFISPDDLQIT